MSLATRVSDSCLYPPRCWQLKDKVPKTRHSRHYATGNPTTGATWGWTNLATSCHQRAKDLAVSSYGWRGWFEVGILSFCCMDTFGSYIKSLWNNLDFKMSLKHVDRCQRSYCSWPYCIIIPDPALSLKPRKPFSALEL